MDCNEAYKSKSNVSYQKYCYVICVTTDEVWTGNWNYWTLTDYNYDNLAELETPKVTVTAANTNTFYIHLYIHENEVMFGIDVCKSILDAYIRLNDVEFYRIKLVLFTLIIIRSAVVTY